MKTVPNEPPRVVSLTAEPEAPPESCEGTPEMQERPAVRVSYVVEDPLGWNRDVAESLDFGDGETFTREIRTQESDGTYRHEGRLVHSYTPGKTYHVKLAVSVPGCTGHSTVAEAAVCLEYPTIESVEASPTCIRAGSTRVHFTCSAVPPKALSGHPLEYLWNFDDGTPEVVQTVSTVSHVFDKPGDYTVTVSVDVKDRPIRLPATSSTEVSVRVPEITVSSRHLSPTAISFTCDVNDPCGATPSKVQWELGDGTTFEKAYGDNPSYKYAEEGIYQGKVTVIMGDGAEFTKSFTVYAKPPQVSLTADHTVLHPGQSASFQCFIDGWSPNEFAYYRWDFGDGYGRSGFRLAPEVSHVYKKVGTYTTTLELWDGYGDEPDFTRTVYVRVLNPLVPRFTYSPGEVYASQRVILNASTSSVKFGKIATYKWHITNDELDYSVSRTGPKVEWTPCWEGSYTVELTVTDTYGNSNTISETIQADLDPDRVCAGDILYHPPLYHDIARIKEELQGLGEGDFELISPITGHVGIVTCDGKVVEAVRNGVRILDSVEDFIHHYRDSNIKTVMALRVTGVSASIRKKAVEFAEQKIGRKYDFASIFSCLYYDLCPVFNPVRLPICKQIFGDRYYCSELVWAAYQVGSGAKEGLLADEYGTVDLDPDDFLITAKYNIVLPFDIYRSPKTKVIKEWDAAKD